jgi:predicted neutral ceramidase superfamily lipid hydrolase
MDPQPLPAPVVEAPVPVVEALVPVVETAVEATAPEAAFSSLYDSQNGTFVAITFGMAVVIIVQVLVNRIFGNAKTMIEALTFFATSMVAFLVAIYLCDLLIAGPDVLLLREGERAQIVGFVKDICLMVFAYFFGTKSAETTNPSPSEST